MEVVLEPFAGRLEARAERLGLQADPETVEEVREGFAEIWRVVDRKGCLAMGLRNRIKRLERDTSEDLASFELLDGSTYYFDRLETYKELFLHAYDVQLGDADKWPEPPEIYRNMCEARCPAAILERLKPEYPERAFVNLAELYDTNVLVNERRLVPLYHAPVEDLSE